eukprot:1195808-Prorocentrum_minimum.AAC.3
MGRESNFSVAERLNKGLMSVLSPYNARAVAPFVPPSLGRSWRHGSGVAFRISPPGSSKSSANNWGKH